MSRINVNSLKLDIICKLSISGYTTVTRKNIKKLIHILYTYSIH